MYVQILTNCAMSNHLAALPPLGSGVLLVGGVVRKAMVASG